MFRSLRSISHLTKTICCPKNINIRTFLSEAYYCREVWEAHLNGSLLQRVNVEELYQEQDQRFQKTGQMSAVDVDIFTNCMKNSSYVDEMLDLLHKLRLSADTCNTLNSTSHAAIRMMLQYGTKKDLLNVLDDRINYGVFLDYYTANILMDTFWKENDYTSGARIASQLMLQEELDHPISVDLSLLHCYNYLLKPGEWPILPPPEEPEEEIKIRVKYLRNPFDDEHFDLKEPQKIVGKTLGFLTNKKEDSLNKSFNILGWSLFGKQDKLNKSLKECQDKNIILYKEVLDLVPESCEIKPILMDLKSEVVNLPELLKNNVQKSIKKMSERDIAYQCNAFNKWEEERLIALEEQNKRLSVAKRLVYVAELKKSLEVKETKLWFFDNEEKIELQIEAKEEEENSKMKVTKTKDESEENYIPPEIRPRQLH